ncbi:putative EMP1-like protein, partial [Plasmodium gaboni]
MSNTTTSPSNISTQCVEVKEIVKNVGTSGGNSGSGTSSSSGGEPFVKVCVTTDTKNLDGGKTMMGGNGGVTVDDEDAIKQFMEEFIEAIKHEDSKLKENCNGSPCSNSKINGKNWIWTEAKNGNVQLKADYKDKIGIPPRTQVLCFGNLHGERCKTDVSKIIDSNGTLLTEWIIATKIEGQNLKKRHINDGDKLCKAVKYSYADIGDLIKNTSIWENKWTKLLETNLENLFKKIFHDNIQKSGQTTNSDKYPSDLTLLREAWWNTNKKYIWGALQYSPTNQINSEVFEQPNTDYIPQFLRFAQEWVEHFCEKRKTHAKDVVEKCKKC